MGLDKALYINTRIYSLKANSYLLHWIFFGIFCVTVGLIWFKLEKYPWSWDTETWITNKCSELFINLWSHYCCLVMVFVQAYLDFDFQHKFTSNLLHYWLDKGSYIMSICFTGRFSYFNKNMKNYLLYFSFRNRNRDNIEEYSNII